MPGIDRTVLFEAISALTGTTVKPLTESSRDHSTHEELTITNFLPTVFRPAISTDPASTTQTLQKNKLSLRSQSKHPELSKDGLREDLFVDIGNFLDPLFDYDFRCDSDSSSSCSRGGEPYTRPWGWYRFALKVLDKYPDGNAWLGSYGWRSQSSPGEWPVSFHGTSIEGAKGITGSHYKTDDGQQYGRGIYSTPNIDIAEGYTMFKEFKSKNGKTYKVIMQNRINPKKRIITDKVDYWLIRVPEGTSAEKEKKIVEESIRPYGILIKEAGW